MSARKKLETGLKDKELMNGERKEWLGKLRDLKIWKVKTYTHNHPLEPIAPHRIELDVENNVGNMTLEDAELVYAEGEVDTSCVAVTTSPGVNNPHLETDV